MGLLFLPAVACKDEPPAPADPLEDPWVDAIDEELPADAPAVPADAEAPAEQEAPAAAAPPADAEVGEAPAEPQAAAVEEEPEEAPAEPEAKVARKAASPKAETPTEPAAVEPEAPAEEPEAEAPADTPAEVEPAAPPKPAPKPPEPAPFTIADFSGTYRYVGGDSQRKALEQAIEDAAQQLSVVIRNIGRKRLTESNPIDPSLQFVVTGDKVKIIFSKSGFDAECQVDGPTISYKSPKGNNYKVRIRQSKNKLVQSISDSDGMKTTVYVLSDDRKRLTVHHKITADRLDTPMTYKLSFVRK